jgi:hypothetical protein
MTEGHDTRVDEQDTASRPAWSPPRLKVLPASGIELGAGGPDQDSKMDPTVS